MNNKEILNKSPEAQNFAKYEGKTFHITKDGHTMLYEDIVKDLNRKSFLESELIELKNRIAELEKFKTEHSPLLSYIAIECTTNLSEFKNWLAIRDLEQQAKGVKDFFASVEPKISMGESKLWELQTHNVNCYLDNLRNQAKGGAE